MQTEHFWVTSDRQQSIISSGLIAALQNDDCQSVVSRSPSDLIGHY